MRRVMIASPLGGDEEKNVMYARECMLNAIGRGEAPYVPHLLYPQVLKDTDPAARAQCMRMSTTWARNVDALCVYVDRGISAGVREEIEAAASANVVIEFRTLTKPTESFPTPPDLTEPEPVRSDSSSPESILQRQVERLVRLVNEDGIDHITVSEADDHDGIEIAIRPYNPRKVRMVRHYANTVLPADLTWSITYAPREAIEPPTRISDPLIQGGMLAVPEGALYLLWCGLCRQSWFDDEEPTPYTRCDKCRATIHYQEVK